MSSSTPILVPHTGGAEGQPSTVFVEYAPATADRFINPDHGTITTELAYGLAAGAKGIGPARAIAAGQDVVLTVTVSAPAVVSIETTADGAYWEPGEALVVDTTERVGARFSIADASAYRVVLQALSQGISRADAFSQAVAA